MRRLLWRATESLLGAGSIFVMGGIESSLWCALISIALMSCAMVMAWIEML